MADIIDLRSDTVTKPTPGMRAAIAVGRGGRRRFSRRSHRAEAGRTRGPHSRQGSGPVRAVGDDVEPDLRQDPHPAGRRVAVRRQLPYLQVRGRRRRGPVRRHLPHPRRRLRHPRPGPASGQDSAGQRPPGAHPPGVPGEHAQSRRRQDLSAGKDPGHQPLGPSERPDHAPRRRPPVERHRRHRHPGPGMVPATSTASRSASARAWALRSARPWPAARSSSNGPARSASCSAAACVRPASSPRPACTPWTITSSAWPTTIAMPRSSPRPIADDARPGRSIRPRWRRTWSSRDIDPDLGTAKDVAARLKEHGVLVLPTGPQAVRMCTHLDVSAAQTERAADTIRRALRQKVAVG